MENPNGGLALTDPIAIDAHLCEGREAAEDIRSLLAAV
jgi:hypothetical protein